METLTFNWPDSFAILFCFAGLALIFHGFPSIKIGGTHVYHNYNDNQDEDDEDEEL